MVENKDGLYITDDYLITHNTTIVGSYILWRILKDRKIRILICTINQDKANSMMTFVQENLEKNDKLIHLFGDLKGPLWSRDQIRVKQGVLGIPQNEPTLKVLGVGSRIISAHYDLIVLDDITDEENSKTEYRRKELEDWYNGPLVGTFLGPIQVINIGTRWHEDDIHNYLSNKAGYVTISYKAFLNQEEFDNGIDSVPKVLWPSMKPWNKAMIEEVNKERLLKKKYIVPIDTITLEEIRAHQGETFFQTQYQNCIMSRGISKFKQEWIESSLNRYRDLNGIVPLGLKYYIGVDLGGEDASSDWGVSTCVGMDVDSNIYIVESVRTHSTINNQMDIMKSLDDRFHASKIGIDSAAQQKSITSMAIRENPNLPIVPIKPSVINDRDIRTDRLSVLLETNRILLNPKLTNLIDELRLYPRSRHDDCIDSLCFAIEVCKEESKYDWNQVANSIKVNKNKGYNLRVV
jgi:phage terminase large subunit-like protein